MNIGYSDNRLIIESECSIGYIERMSKGHGYPPYPEDNTNTYEEKKPIHRYCFINQLYMTTRTQIFSLWSTYSIYYDSCCYSGIEWLCMPKTRDSQFMCDIFFEFLSDTMSFISDDNVSSFSREWGMMDIFPFKIGSVYFSCNFGQISIYICI